MKFIFYIILAIHSIIHCFGFLKAFNLVEFNAISQPISKGTGVLWFIAFLFLLTTFTMDAIGFKYWWVIGIAAVIVSQILIIAFWQDAKFGTIPNVYILIVSILALFNHNFTRMVSAERHNTSIKTEKVIAQRSISELPMPIQKWLANSGVDNSTRISNMYLTQSAQLKMKPEQEKWYEAKADQYTVANPPSFNWAVRMNMNPLMPIRGRDKFEEGKGVMQIKMYSFIPIVNVKNNDKINEAALQRFLAEIAWLPSAARNSYIEWEEIDESSSKATMTYKNVTGSGIFHFDENGDFAKFTAMRYKETDPEADLFEWVINATEFKEIDNFRVPVKVEASWKLEDKVWTWLKIEILDIKYNVDITKKVNS